MKAKRILSAIMASVLTLSLLSACGSTEVESSAPSPEPTATAVPESTPLRIVLPGTAPEKLKNGLDAVNKKLQSDGVNESVEISFYDESIYNDKINLLVSSGVEFDLFFSENSNFAGYISSTIATAIDSDISAVSGFKALFPDDVWNSAVSNDKTMGVPVYLRKNNGANFGFFVNETLMKKAGVDLNTESFDDFVSALKTAKGEGSATCLVTDSNAQAKWLYGLSDKFPFAASDELGLVSVGSDGKVSSFCKSGEFRSVTQNYAKLREAGLLSEKITDKIDISERLKSGDFLTVSGSMKDIGNFDFGTNDISFMSFATTPYVSSYDNDYLVVPSTSKNSKGAIEFLNWLYGDSENYDLFHYGTEGTDYSLDKDGRISIKGDSYGIDTALTGYLGFMRYAPSVPVAYIDAITTDAEDVSISPSAGFRFDSTECAEICRRLDYAIIAYLNPLKFGGSNYDDSLDSVIENLNMAGLNQYIEEYKKQYDAYLNGGKTPTEAPESSSESSENSESDENPESENSQEE